MRACDSEAMSDPHMRRTPRVPLEIKVEYKRFNAFIADYTRDISTGGLFVRTDSPLPPGTEAMFTLVIPKVAAPIILRGVVKRVVTGAESPKEPGMGVELLFDDDRESAALKVVIDALMIDHLGEALFRRLVEVQKNSEG